MNGLLQELKILRNLLLRVGVSFFVFTILCFGVPIAPGGISPAQWGIEHIQQDLLPHDIPLLALTPLDGFVARAQVAMLMGAVPTIGMLLLELWFFIAPGLYARERRGLSWFLLSSVVLMLGGAVFAYKILIPFIYQALFAFVPEGAVQYFAIGETIASVVGLLFVTSLLFLIPVGMALLSGLGLVSPSFWAIHARHAVLLVLLLSAIITPDGSGVSMVLLAVPVCGLYTIGYGASRVVSRGTERQLVY
ncbi:twin-arginine translocase subunit TatC [Candidatus Nomurabacteria bacterium]|nr:twin-arginine translocase subunit TatC [Candidatus Nomurabacteria bacterium]